MKGNGRQPANDKQRNTGTKPRLLTQNTRLKKQGVWNWTLPAFAGRLPDGRPYNTCPAAGECKRICYALRGTYNIPNVRAAHQRNLTLVLDDLANWEAAVLTDVRLPSLADGWVRIHDAGDFFSDEYLSAWLRIVRAVPDVTFYCYTKEVSRFRRLVEPDPPANLLSIFSAGGKEDHLLDWERDRIADVFPTEEEIVDAGWHSQFLDDRLAVLGPAPVGMAANSTADRNKLGGWRLSELQRRADEQLAQFRRDRADRRRRS